MSKETIGKRIKIFRKGRGLTQAQLAKDLGYSHKSVITHIEKGESEMSYEKILLLLRTYAIDANDFFGIKHIDNLIEKYKKREEEKNSWVKDILFDINGELFSYRIGGILIKDNKILLTRHGNDYAVPGGHAQIGETSSETIIREFKEETGFDVLPINVIATYENFWNWNNKKCHQLCIFYRLKMVKEGQKLSPNPDTLDSTIEWVDFEQINNINLYPTGIAQQIIENKANYGHFINKDQRN